MEQYSWLLLIFMPLVSFLYASVGHGGASSYLMLLTWFGFPPGEMRQAALIMNIIVAGMSFYSYFRVIKFPVRFFLNITAFSIPASFLGGMMQIDPDWYRRILGLLLLLPAMRFFRLFTESSKPLLNNQQWITPLLGAGIGFLSGLIGIGGGIILSPLLLMLGWFNVKETAALSAGFIVVNSLSGLAGTGFNHLHLNPIFHLIIPLTIAGGMAGAYAGAKRFNTAVLRYLLAVVLLIASVKFIFS